MKKLLLIASALVLTAFWACQPTINPGPEEEDSAVILSDTRVSVPVEGDIVTIQFSANVPWTAASDQNWLTVTPASGEAGTSCTVKASAVKNESTDSRTAKVTITAGKAKAEVEVVQGQVNDLKIAVTDYTVSAEGGEVEVTVSANVDYVVVIPEAVDWVTVNTTKGMTDTKVVFTVAETHEYAEEYLEDWTDDHIVRSANITIQSGNLSSGIVINQKTFTPYFDYTGDWAGLQWSFYSGTPTEIPQEGADIVIPVETNIDWRVYFSVWDNDLAQMVDSWDVGWAKLSFDTEKSEIHLIIEENDTFFARDQYLYAECSIDGVPDGSFGGLGQFHQPGKEATGAVATLAWKGLFDAAITPGYNRLAYKTEGGDALLLSDGSAIHAISPADGTYWKAITLPGITPTSICNDDAYHVIIADDTAADMDWGAGVLLTGTEIKVYCASNVNETPREIVLPNGLYGTVGGLRARGDIATKGSITGIAGGASFWFGYDMAEYAPVANYYGTQNSGALAGPNTVWVPGYAAAITLGDDLHEGLLYRGYDGAESLYFRKDCYNPAWAMGDAYEAWTLVSEGGAGGNENQNNLDVVDYMGKKIVAFTQGFHFDYSSNATVYVLDVTDPKNPNVLLTIAPEQYITYEGVTWSGSNSADVLLHPASDCLELYVAQSGMKAIAKFSIVLQ